MMSDSPTTRRGSPNALSSRFGASWLLKVTMAVTGLIWVLFVLVHLFGNLKVFSGPESFNNYAHWLRYALYPLLPVGFLLWALRIILLTALLTHIVCAAILWSRGRRARGRRTGASFRWRLCKPGSGGRLQAVSAALMPVTGIAILTFITFHILDLTTGTRPIASGDFQAATSSTTSAYQNLVASFQRPWVAAIYVIAMLLLSLHALHGIRTAANDLGAMGYRLRAAATWAAGLVALVILLGNGAIPVAVQLGITA